MAIGTTAAIIGSSLLGAGASIAGNRSQANAARNAANASQQATAASVAEQRRQYDLSRQDMMPWLTAGNSALNTLAGLYGLNTTQTTNLGVGTPAQGGLAQGTTASTLQYAPTNISAPGVVSATQTSTNPFYASPDYQFRLDEQMRALTAKNAALGIQDSGAAQKAALEYSGNLASSEFNNYANRLSSLAGVGQTAAQSQAAAGQNYANSYGNLLSNNAQNLASSYATQGAANANMWGNLAGIGSGLLNYYGGR